jgi:predicted HicB family RNase H-like nuclease
LDRQIYSSPSYTSSTNIKQKQQVTKSHNNNNNKRSESITFRLDSIILNKLRNEANQKDVSINTLVSQIIKQHTDWHSNAAKAGIHIC